MKISTRSITLAATLTAMCFVTGLLPYVFFLPVTVAATTLSVGIAAFVGFAFGAVSVAYSFLIPTGSFVGVAFMHKLIEHIAKPQKRAAKFAAVSASATIGSLLNTALVVSMFVLILPNLTAGGATLAVAVPQMLISGAIECVCMAAITPPITLTLNKVVLRGKDLRNRHVPQTPEVSDK